MIAALLDTATVVDALRGHPPTVAWLAQQGSLGVSAIVWLEIIEGAPDRQAEQAARRFERVDVLAKDSEWAIRQLLRLHLSHGLDSMDCLIASASHRLDLPLYTCNLKHFTPLLGDLARRPY